MPLLGSYGGSSEYAYRGTLDDFPNDFSFTNLIDVDPGLTYISESITITGINNKSIVNISPGSTISINNGPFIATSEISTTFVQNNDTIRIRIETSSGNLTDFSKTYSSTVKVGRKSTTWTILTRAVDETPDLFVFTNLVNQEVGVALTSNEIVLSGLDFGFAFPASITSGNGLISINGGPLVSSGSVFNGDRIYLRLNSPFEFSNNPAGSGVKSNQTFVRVGTVTTSWSISTREPDLFIEPFEFNDLNNVQPSSVFEAQSVNSLGVVSPISGADPGLELIAQVSGCDLRVEQPAPLGGWLIRKDFSNTNPDNLSPFNTILFNGDRLTARISSASTFSQTKVGIVTISNQSGRFIVTTRPRPIDTIPDPFTFTDLTGQRRNVLVESNEVTLVGMSTFGDQGVASIVTGTTGGNAQYQITRGTSIVKPFGIGTAFVQNGDKIKLRITTSNESNGTVNATFRVDGIDTSIILSGQTGFRDDIWTVGSTARVCDVTPFTITTLNNAERNTRVNTSFAVNGFENDCNMRVSVSGDSTATLSVSGSTLTNNIPVSPGTQVNLSLTTGDFSQTKTVTITVSNSSSGVVPSRTYTTTWTVNTRADNTPTSVTLTAEPSSIQTGGSATLTWSSVNAARVTSTTGFTDSRLSGFTIVTPTITSGTQSYSISVEPNPGASNFPVIQTATTNVTVIQDTTPDNFSLSPTSYTNQNQGSQVSFTAQSSTNPSVSVSGLTSGVTVTASVTANTFVFLEVNGVNRGTSFNVQNGDRIVVRLTNGTSQGFTASGTLSIGSVSRTFSSTTTSCTVTTSTLDLASGVTVSGVSARVTYQNGSTVTETGSNSLYTGSSGFSLFGTAKAGSTGGSVRRQVSGSGSFTITESGVNQAFGIVVGAGGAGGRGSDNTQSGGGGGGYSGGTFPVSPGGTISWDIAGSTTYSSTTIAGNASQIRYQNTTVLLARGGRCGNFGGGGGDAATSPNIDRRATPGAPGSIGEGGAGGGAGLAGGQGATPGTPLGGSGGGGGGAGIDAQGTTTNVRGQNGVAGNQGVSGATAGGGGGHSGPPLAARGGTGAAGAGYFQYFTQPSPSTTWNDLITAIVDTYKSSANRPPKLSEIRSFSNSFISNSGQTLDQLKTQIIGSLTSATRASSFTDNCGGFF